MRKSLFILLSIILFSCGNGDPKEQLNHINGYWEIDHVQVEKDSVIKYGFSQYIDYIKITDTSGYRKKLQPEMDGSFKTTKSSEKVKPEIKEGKLFLNYSTPYDKWTEEVLDAGEDELVLKNRDGKVYYYHRYKPITLEEHEAKKE